MLLIAAVVCLSCCGCAYFENTDHFVNVVEGGGMFGYDAILNTLGLMREAYLEPKDMRNLIQIKGMGCGGCV